MLRPYGSTVAHHSNKSSDRSFKERDLVKGFTVHWEPNVAHPNLRAPLVSSKVNSYYFSTFLGPLKSWRDLLKLVQNTSLTLILLQTYAATLHPAHPRSSQPAKSSSGSSSLSSWRTPPPSPSSPGRAPRASSR